MLPFLTDHGVDQRTPRVARKTSLDLPRLTPLVALGDLLGGLIPVEDWEALSAEARAEITGADPDEQLALLVKHMLLTEFQRSRIEAGNSFGLLLGNYRVQDAIGSGGMGIVYRGEHVLLRRPVAIKVLHALGNDDTRMLERFHREVRAVAQLQHPNVVGAIDAGVASAPDGHSVTMHYFVMEYVPGQDLEQLVKAQGPLPVTQACDIIFQIASALAEADKQGLVHRDIKPSNIQITPSGQAKLLDFGLARLLCQRVTMPGLAMGSICYMSPEQSLDASAVDIRTDIYALGGTLHWCLTGAPPFPNTTTVVASLSQRQKQRPPSLDTERPDVPVGLRALLQRMMALKPEDRFQTPQAVMDALLPYLKPEMREDTQAKLSVRRPKDTAEVGPGGARVHRVLIVDDEEGVRELCRTLLSSETVRCDGVADGLAALEAVRSQNYDLVLLDIDMPRLNGRETLKRLREAPPCPHLKVIMFSGRESGDDMADLLAAGADDYVPKPFSVVQLQARMKAALRFKDAQDRSELLNRRLLATNSELEASLSDRDFNLAQVRNGLVLALAKLVEYRDSETGQHLLRLQRYCECLAEEAARMAPFDQQIDARFIAMLVGCVPLHDIGKAVVPDHILLKPGKLDPTERMIMQRHTVVGREALSALTVQHGLPPAFLQMAIDISCHHHERFDGQGYPDQLAGSDIPLAARIVAIADVYDALRARRVYKPSLSHATAVQVMLKVSEGQFDPGLLAAFARCAPQFDRIFNDFPD
jgi:response regulator RpfG family c-di-GMP phosphodiesterase/serine/threonine protein kinase